MAGFRPGALIGPIGAGYTPAPASSYPSYAPPAAPAPSAPTYDSDWDVYKPEVKPPSTEPIWMHSGGKALQTAWDTSLPPEQRYQGAQDYWKFIENLANRTSGGAQGEFLQYGAELLYNAQKNIAIDKAMQGQAWYKPSWGTSAGGISGVSPTAYSPQAPGIPPTAYGPSAQAQVTRAYKPSPKTQLKEILGTYLGKVFEPSKTAYAAEPAMEPWEDVWSAVGKSVPAEPEISPIFGTGYGEKSWKTLAKGIAGQAQQAMQKADVKFAQSTKTEKDTASQVAAYQKAADKVAQSVQRGLVDYNSLASNPELQVQVADSLLYEGLLTPEMTANFDETDLTRLILHAVEQDKTPPITEEQLRTIQDGKNQQDLWDAGVYLPQIPEILGQVVDSYSQAYGVSFDWSEDDLHQLSYKDIVGLALEPGQWATDDWSNIVNNYGAIRLKMAFKGIDDEGNYTYSGSWDWVKTGQAGGGFPAGARPYLQPSTAQEAAAAGVPTPPIAPGIPPVAPTTPPVKPLEPTGGPADWASYTGKLDTLNLSPLMDAYFRSTGQFNSLQREWQASGSGLTWEDWLKQYNFKGQIGGMSPYQRGERPGIYSPRMRSVSY